MDRRKTVSVVFCFCLIVLSLYAKDQPAVMVKTGGIYFPACGIAGDQARAEIAESGAELIYRFKVKKRLPVKLSFKTAHTDISQGSHIDLPSHLEEQGLDLETTFPFPLIDRENIFLRLGITPSFLTDNWDCPSSAFRIPLRAAAVLLHNDKFTFFAGARIAFDFEREFIPFLGMICKPAPDWTLELIPPRPRVIFSIREGLRLFAEAEYSAREYEVSRNSSKGLVLRKKRVICGLGMAYDLGSNKEFIFSGGRVLNHYLKYADSSGKISLDNCWYLRCAFKAGF